MKPSKYMKVSIGGLALLSALLLGACAKSTPQFVVEGSVTGAEHQVLYLEEVGTGKVLSLDSVELDEAGSFRFTHGVSGYPMFYRLRLGQESIPFVADSATRLSVKAGVPGFFGSYQLEQADSANIKIKEVAHLRSRVDSQVEDLIILYNGGVLRAEALHTRLDSLVGGFKQTLMEQYIFPDPKSPVAYFALFQRRNEGEMYFSVDEAKDERAFAAVATAYDSFYPTAPYTPFLKDIALRSVAQGRQRRSWERVASDTTKRIEVLTFPELELLDTKGKPRSLKAFVEEHPEGVLLSFTSYQADWSPRLVGMLRELQQRRPELHIYEVSVDNDAYYWKNAAHNLPWLCLSDPSGNSLLSYNVGSLPAFFLIKGDELRRLPDLSGL